MIKLTDYMDIINCDMRLRYYSSQNCRWSACFDNCEVKDSSNDLCLTSGFGNGNTPDEAIKDYIDSIKGKILVFNASDSKCRREYLFPDNVSYQP